MSINHMSTVRTFRTKRGEVLFNIEQEIITNQVYKELTKGNAMKEAFS